MKKLLIGSTTFIAIAAFGLARAADMPPPAYKAPPPPAPVYNWTGCYINGGVGYGMWKQDHYAEVGTLVETPTISTGGEGWLGRVGGGCDYQFSMGNLGNWVIGAFGDYDFMGLSGSFIDPWTGWVGNENESGAWAVGGRLGYLVTPTLLAFFDGGYTQANFDRINLSFNAVPSVSTGNYFPAQTYSGWFIGGGAEYALTWLPIPGVFWRSEYRYASYESANVPMLTATGTPFITGDSVSGPLSNHMQKYVQTITTSLVWRFNFGGN
jgi:outer membrane immunogenic protein